MVTVSVGYQYTDCEKIYWDKQATTLSGFVGGDLSSSDRSVAKGWSLNIQHFYNYRKGGRVYACVYGLFNVVIQ